MSRAMEGKVAIVTGAGGDIGRAIAMMLCNRGAQVVCMDLNERRAAEVARSINVDGGACVSLGGDVSSSADAKRATSMALDTFGGLHVLVNNAAFFMQDAVLPEVEEEQFDRSFAVNVGGVFRMSKYAIPVIKRSGGGSIVHVASQMGHVARKYQATYCASKGALLVMAKAMALDHALDGIRVNTVSPGGIATQGMADQWGGIEIAEKEWGAKMHPIGRLGTMAEVAEAVCFLAGDAASFITGTDILVDGGYTAC